MPESSDVYRSADARNELNIESEALLVVVVEVA